MAAEGSSTTAIVSPLKLPLSDKVVDLKAFCQILASTQAREKALKFIQYTAKLLAYFLLKGAGNAPDLGAHFKQLAKNLSMARRCLKFIRWFKHFEDIADAKAERDPSFQSWLYLDVVVNVVADVTEDVMTLEKVGFIKKGILPKRMEMITAWCQLKLAVVEIVVTHVKAKRAQDKASLAGASLEVKRKSILTYMDLSKYYADLIKAFWDCELSFSSELAYCLSGMWAGLCGAHKYSLKVVK
mmetsp:Transcript_5289/g.7441  ORF Transcript_5289/g.7441 Transcript_5289/m.7441 type:complete len:242 (-) Transcript_5289:124-849(-)|eukprot:CAMPEP_0194769594 /NCGR_PEP_ID=MMETSP0323_2-20130528/43620_1 /TAXON_ID=2866 ORGANISM="Crypthecodinium cohnii, Strain Seligo" /NCGR_SAMPLE_ID=MMETSP0323_2 /ASSEMBLY_ACC=CAM_ASM_000346 /LENGTH=241 /DNA_ID=CAMNT_0039702663 /DNA_START=10 /DNA_END=735 /DNA_ORIENTATION=+